METTTRVPERNSTSAEPNPNHYNIKVGETVIMDAEVGKPTDVKVDRIGNKGYLVYVTEIKSGIKWILTGNCLTRVTEIESNS